MVKSALVWMGTVLGATAMTAACSGSGDACEDTFCEPDAGGGGNSSGGRIGGDGNNGAAGKPSTPPGELAQCASQTFGGTLLPMQLTTVLDTSSSMCLTANGFDCAAPETRWQNTTKALRAFLTAEASRGLTLAFRLFGPIDKYDYSGGGDISKHRCDPAGYTTPQYLPKDLPWTEAEAAFLNNEIGIDTSDGNLTQTQTGAALRGAITYTSAERGRLADQKGVGILLVTDGIPAGCDPASPFQNSKVDDDLAIRAAREAKEAGLKVFVLNLGGQEDVLYKIAEAAGTAAIVVDGANQNEVISKLNQIRGEALSCEFALPKPSGGGKVDTNKINLGWIKSPGASSDLLLKSDDCANQRGWQYDDPQAPTSIRLCGAICDEVLANPTGQIDVVLGCETRDQPVN